MIRKHPLYLYGNTFALKNGYSESLAPKYYRCVLAH